MRTIGLQCGFLDTSSTWAATAAVLSAVVHVTASEFGSMHRIPRLIIILSLLLSGRSALALNPERHITELVHRVWDSKSGAPAGIRAVAQSTDGYLWVGGSRGLYRFDGTQFQEFDPGSGAALPSREILGLFAAPDGGLWIGYHNGGVSLLKNGRITNFNSVDGFPEGGVTRFAEQQNGRLWAASTGGLAYFAGDKWHTVGRDSDYPGTGAQTVFVDHLGALWVAGDHIAVLNPGSSKFELADELNGGQVYQLAESPDGTLWMAETSRAVRPIKRPGDAPYNGITKDDCQSRFPDTWQTEPRCRRSDDLEVRVGSAGILFDKNGSLWITTLGDGLRRAPYPLQLPKQPINEFSNALEKFTSKDGLSSDVGMAIFEDREGNIWVATRDGIDQFRDSSLAPLILGPSAGQLTIAPDNDGYVVAVADSGHIFRFHDAHNKISVTDKDTQMYAPYRDPFGAIWAIGSHGACKLVGGECAARLENPGEPRSWGKPWRLAVDGNHRVWAYVEKQGLFTLENSRWTRSGSLPATLQNAVPMTVDTGEGGIWFGFKDGRVLRLTDGLMHLYSQEDGLTLGEIKAIDSTAKDTWVAGERGLALLRGSRFTSVVPDDIPAFSSVSGVVEADDGSLWLNEYRGIIRISPSEVSAILHESSHRAHYETLSAVDGLPGATVQSHVPTAIRGTDGRVWFVTSGGLAWVDPRHLYQNRIPPPVVIQSVVADGKTLPPSGNLELPARTINLQIAYSALSLSVPERVQFRYRLKGLDHEWQNVGTRRTAYFSRIPPGSYGFQVIASNDAGVWNDVGAELRLRIPSAWYQTLWFRSVCAAVLVALLWGIYRLRLRYVARDFERSMEARIAERTRIARDLHDTLLQSFQALLLHLHVISRLLPTQPQEGQQKLNRAIDQATEAISEGRDAVQDLRSAVTARDDLASSLNRLGQELGVRKTDRDATAPVFQVGVHGRLRDLRPIARDEVYRIAGEAIRNAFYHAESQHIEIEIEYGERQLQLRVRDDGKGIDPKLLGGDGSEGHYGLRGMRERAKLVGGKLTIGSQPLLGTEVKLTIPAGKAYMPS